MKCRVLCALVVLSAVTVVAGAAERRNMILLIGDGMGVGQVSTASYVAGPLVLESAAVTGLMRTHADGALVTDSAASGTAMATGHKTARRTVGELPDGRVVGNLMESARAQGLATGVVTTSGLVDATPATFVAHSSHRYRFRTILEQMLTSGVDVLIGGDFTGYRRTRDDAAYLDVLAQAETLVPEGTTVVRNATELASASAPVVALLPPRDDNTEQHGPPLAVTTAKALDLLAADPDGFFVMIEQETTDQAGHANDVEMVVEGVLELDQAVRVALRYAGSHPGTLVVVTADHDTGGMGIVGGRAGDAAPRVGWATTTHTAQWVPVFAFGAGAEAFGGVFENTELAQRIGAFLELEGFPAEPTRVPQ